MTVNESADTLPPETADGIELKGAVPQDTLRPDEIGAAVGATRHKASVMGVPTDTEAKPVNAEHTRFGGEASPGPPHRSRATGFRLSAIVFPRPN